MTDESPPPEPVSHSPAPPSQTHHPAPPKPRRPRIWLTVGEIVGVLALVVAGLSYWDTHRERVVSEKERSAEERRAAAQRAFAMTAEVQSDGDRLKLTPVHADQPIQAQVFLFPHQVRGDPVQVTGNARIEAGWFAHGLNKARERAHLKPEAGDARLPVGVVTTYLDGADTRTDRALYDIGYDAQHRLLGEPRIRLDGLSFAGRVGGGDLQARVDAVWARRTGQGAKPAPQGPPD